MAWPSRLGDTAHFIGVAEYRHAAWLKLPHTAHGKVNCGPLLEPDADHES